jgi:hypothetical protein
VSYTQFYTYVYTKHLWIPLLCREVSWSVITWGIKAKIFGNKVPRRVLNITKFKWAGNRGNYGLIQKKFVVCSHVLVLFAHGNEEYCSRTSRRRDRTVI